MTPVFAVVLAAGSGARFGEERPKQLAPLAGETVLRRALRPFLAHPRIEKTIVVAAAERREEIERAIGDLGGLGVEIVPGGASRTASVRAGIDALVDAPRDAAVLVHDGARPLASGALLDRVLDGLERADAVSPALPVADALRRVDGALLGEEIARDGLFAVQTPQGFRLGPFAEAHAANNEAMTDDALLMRARGHAPIWVLGERANLKITYREDLAMAEALARAGERTAIGTGFDAHRFEAGRALILGGVRIEHDRGLSGHSDADVALHAIADAILGALADGDIGAHFPPHDPRWKDADSAELLGAVVERALARAARIEHLDLTILCEAPKIGPHREAMRARIAEIARIGRECVSVKATTMEKMGFTGRREGIAASATATLALPR